MPLPRLRRRGPSERARVINPAAGAGEQNLARVFENFAAQQAEGAVRTAEATNLREGFTEGAESDELLEASNLTRAGRAFNKGARVAHLANVRRDIKTRLAELVIETNKLPPEQWLDAFVKTSDGMRDGLLSEIAPQVRGDALNYFNDTASNHRLKILDAQQAELRSQTIQDLENGRVSLLDDINNAAREQNQKLLTVRQREYEAMLQGAVDEGIMSQPAADAGIKAMHSNAIMGEALGMFDDVLENEGLDAAAEVLATFKRKDASDMLLAAEEKDQLETTMTALFNREASIVNKDAARNKAAVLAANFGLNNEADNMIGRLKAGFPVPPERVRGMVARLSVTEKAEKLADLQQALVLQSKVNAAQAAPWPAQQQLLQDIQSALTEGGGDFALFEALDADQRRTAALLESDPRAVAQQHGLLPGDERMDTSSVEGFATSLATRRENTAPAEEHFGQRIPALYDFEAAALGEFWSQSDIPQKLAITQSIVEGLGMKGDQLMQQLDKHGHRQMAFIGGLQSEDQQMTAAAVLRGTQILRDSKTAQQFLPQGTERSIMSEHVNARIGSALTHFPELRANALNAIDAWYVDRAAIDGDASASFDKNRADDAVLAVLGNVVEDLSGHSTIARGIDQDQWERWLFGINAEQIAAAGGMSGFDDENAAQRIRSAQVLYWAPGQYKFTLPNPFSDVPGVVKNAAGEDLILALDPLNLPEPEPGDSQTVFRNMPTF